jgi:hypothetical protein
MKTRRTVSMTLGPFVCCKQPQHAKTLMVSRGYERRIRLRHGRARKKQRIVLHTVEKSMWIFGPKIRPRTDVAMSSTAANKGQTREVQHD